MELEITRRSEGKCKCASEIKGLNEELSICRSTIDHLSMKLKEQQPPFCEESLKDDNTVLFHTGLPNFKVLKAIFDHVLQTLPNEGISKLTPFPGVHVHFAKTEAKCSIARFSIPIWNI